MASSQKQQDGLFDEIKHLILSKDYGSVEIYIESGEIVQITERTIRKTNGESKSLRRRKAAI